MWIPVYECPECGTTWEVTVEERVAYDDEDADNDDTKECLVCKICDSEVLKQKKDENGNLLYHLITEDELEEDEKNSIDGTSLDESYFDDDELDYIHEDFYEDE